MTKRILPAAALFLMLSACENKPTEVSTVAPDPMAAVLANKAPVELPPAIKKEVTFRCKDNSLVYVTFFQGDKQVVVRTEKGGTPTMLKGAEAGKPLTADGGWSLTGSTSEVTLTRPGKSAIACHS
jgi:hypothetical protein